MAGIYRNQTEGIISLSSDGTTRITIADKNLGATQVYNSGDALSEANSGKYYQRGNNYGFPFTGSIGDVTGTVDTTGYGPGNYYSDSAWRSSGTNWSNPSNNNLWGGETGTVEATQGPCENGFHIPSSTELTNLISLGTTMGVRSSSNGNGMKTYLKLPFTGMRDRDTTISYQGSYGYYWANNAYNNDYSYFLDIGATQSYILYDIKTKGITIRPFKNEAVIPDRTWTKLYGDDILPPFLKWFIKNGNYYYFGDTPIHISGLTLDKSSIALTTVGQTEQLTATISPEGAVETKVVWSSSDESMATVSQTGLVTCVTPGECTITATCGGYSASCSVISLITVADYITIDAAGGSFVNSQYYGVKFEALKSGSIKEVGFLNAGTITGTLAIGVGNYISQITGTRTQYSLTAENTSGGVYQLTTPYQITAGTNYVICLSTSGNTYYLIKDGVFPTTGTAVRYDYSMVGSNNTPLTSNLYDFRYIKTEYTP